MPPAVTLSFRTGNSPCDNSIEIACLKLITETVGLLSDPADAAPTGLLPAVKDSEEMVMEEGENGNDLEVRTTVRGFSKDSISTGCEFLAGSACAVVSSTAISSTSINSPPDELLDMDLPSETGTPTSMEVEKNG